MKTIKRMLVVVFMLTIVTGYSNEVEKDPIRNITTFRFLNAKKGHQVSIVDANGNVIHREIVERNGQYMQRFDLTNLKDGLYTIELNKDFEIVIKPFKMTSNEVVFLKSKEKTVYKPVVRTEKNLLMISQLALNKEPLKIELYYNDVLIHKDVLGDATILERVYNLSKTEKGSYKLKMTSGSKSYIERFNI